MENFQCDNCGMTVFFENDRCEKCGQNLGFSPDTLKMMSEKKWLAASNPADQIKRCQNYNPHKVCNWLVTGRPDEGLCLACDLNEMIPDLSIAGNVERWKRIELAKRRCLCSYLRLGLPVCVEKTGQHPLKFRFLADTANEPVLTGHHLGVITINIVEADDDERERRKLRLYEPYRTLVGHFRHETGHYYWDRLVANSEHLNKFRELFGDETLDYAAAMKKYYQEGPVTDWQERTVTPYASWHPWEDWAESWAHYLHMVDTMETAATFNLGINNLDRKNETPKKVNGKIVPGRRDFNKILSDWQPLTLALNAINRGMGISDLYPFVLSPIAVEKLRFIHDLIETTVSARFTASKTN